MNQQNNFDFPEKIQDAVYTEFCKLPLPAKLSVFAKVAHGTAFKPVNNDLLGLDKKLVSKYYNDFLEAIRSSINEPSKSNPT